MIEPSSPDSIPASNSQDYSGQAPSQDRQREISQESIQRFRTALSGKAGDNMDKFSDSRLSGSWNGPGGSGASETGERSAARSLGTEARDLFQSRMNSEGGQRIISGSNSGDNQRQQTSELSDIFSAVFSGRSDIAPAGLRNEFQGPAPAPEAAPPPSSGEELMKIANALVDKILVSDPRSTAGSQVMITMNSQSQLAGTEIVLTRSNDGTLAVVINSANDSQYRKINEAREKLELALKKLERGSFTVTVNPPDQEGTEA
ncbi:hypothetical protein [Succinimonas amylolytica]|uniref:hypothetical protein n=1 Tax=Succinimonas amylolytica TaxID=83769 RepID=UPI0023A86BFC